MRAFEVARRARRVSEAVAAFLILEPGGRRQPETNGRRPGVGPRDSLVFQVTEQGLRATQQMEGSLFCSTRPSVFRFFSTFPFKWQRAMTAHVPPVFSFIIDPGLRGRKG